MIKDISSRIREKSGENNMNDLKRRRIILLAVFLACLIAIIIVFATNSGLFSKIIYTLRGDEKTASEYWDEHRTVYIDGTAYLPKKNVSTYLLIGVDKDEEVKSNYSYINDARADFLVMLVVNDKDKSYSIVHVNRDTMSEVDVLGIGNKKVETVNAQIALAHTYGDGMEVSCRNTVKSVSSLFFGAPIETYISLNFGAVPILNDYVGGVTITVPEDLTDIDPRFTKGAVVKLNGNDAKSYVRSRQGVQDESNTSRMARQRTYMEAYMNSVIAKGYDDESFLMTYANIAPYTVTNFNSSDASALFDKIDTYEYLGMRTIDGELNYDDEYVRFFADKESLKKIAVDLLYDKK